MNASIRKPFDGDYPVAFVFGAWPDSETIQNQYKSWGLSGHNGIDYGLQEGVEVLATDSGKVIKAGSNRDFGNSVTIKHEWGESLYPHLSAVSVALDQEMDKGDKIGLSGQTGNAFGAHIHFAIKPNDSKTDNGYLGYIDPSPYFEKKEEPPPENPKESEVKVVEKIVEKEVVKEVPVEKIVDKEVIKEVIKEIVKEVPREPIDEELKLKNREKLREYLKLANERKKKLKKDRIGKILEFIKNHPKTSNKDLRKLLPQLSEATVTRYLDILEKEGKIIQQGKYEFVSY